MFGDFVIFFKAFSEYMNFIVIIELAHCRTYIQRLWQSLAWFTEAFFSCEVASTAKKAFVFGKSTK